MGLVTDVSLFAAILIPEILRLNRKVSSRGGVESRLPMKCSAHQKGTVMASDVTGLCSGSSLPSYDGSVNDVAVGRNRELFCTSVGEFKPLKYLGLTAKYPVLRFIVDFKPLVEELSALDIARAGKTDLEKVYSLLALARVSCIVRRASRSCFRMISWSELNIELQQRLEPSVETLCAATKCNRETARRFSMMMGFNVLWDECLRIVRSVCKEGGLTHQFKYEDALAIIHMKTEEPTGFLGIPRGSENEKLEYARCLLGALVKVLKSDGEIPEEFNFWVPDSLSVLSLFLHNAISFLTTYARCTKGWRFYEPPKGRT